MTYLFFQMALWDKKVHSEIVFPTYASAQFFFSVPNLYEAVIDEKENL